MKHLKRCCLDCGSPAVATMVDELLPYFRMERVTYACGAELKSIVTRNNGTGRVCLSGCCTVEEQVAPI